MQRRIRQLEDNAGAAPAPDRLAPLPELPRRPAQDRAGREVQRAIARADEPDDAEVTATLDRLLGLSSGTSTAAALRPDPTGMLALHDDEGWKNEVMGALQSIQTQNRQTAAAMPTNWQQTRVVLTMLSLMEEILCMYMNHTHAHAHRRVA